MDMTNSRPHKTRKDRGSLAQMDSGHIAESIKNIAKGIHEGSFKMRKTVRILHQSGAINDLTQAVYEATVAARDTAREIRDTARDLKEEDIIGGTARAIQETSMAVRVAADTVRNMATETQEMPKAIMTRLPEWSKAESR
jgi:methyl-accepting chemotaxis protein